MPLDLGPSVAGGTHYTSPMVGPVNHTQQVKVDLSALVLDVGSGGMVDADGYLKPGSCFYWTTALATAVAATQPVKGIVIAPIQLPIVVPVTAVTLAAETLDCFITVCTHGVVNRDIAEDQLGRALNADEIAGFDLAGSHLRLTQT